MTAPFVMGPDVSDYLVFPSRLRPSLSGLTPREICVYMELRCMSAEDLRNTATIAAALGLGVSTAKEAVAALKAAGWVTLETAREKDERGQWRTTANQYSVHINPVT